MSKNKLIKVLLVSVFIIIVLVVFIMTNPNPVKPSSYKCPRDYKTNQEYLDGIDTWINEVTTKNPKITDEEMKIERDSLFKDNNCEQGYWVDNTKTDGSPNGTILLIPEPVLTKSEKSELKTYTDDLGFSFRYPSNMSVKVIPKLDPANTQIIAIKPKNTEDNLIIISVANNDENISPEEWLLGPTSGFKVSDEYHITTIDGQNIVYTDNNMWFVINTPDNKYRLSIADLNPDKKSRLFKEMGIIITSLKFKI